MSRITSLVCLFFLFSCNSLPGDGGTKCGIDFDHLNLKNCPSDPLQVKTKSNSLGKPALLKFNYAGNLVREDTIIYSGENIYFITKVMIHPQMEPITAVYSHVSGSTYGFLFSKFKNNIGWVWLLETQKNNLIKIRFTKQLLNIDLLALKKKSHLKELLNDSNFSEDCIYFKYYYKNDSLHYQVEADFGTWSAPSPWMSVKSISKNIYLDQQFLLDELPTVAASLGGK